MEVTIFGDIHGNLVALERLFEIEKDKTDLFICHGDLVNYGPWSNECVQFLEAFDCVLLKGNHEEYFLQENYDGKNIVASAFFNFCVDKFDKKLKMKIQEYASFYEFDDVRIQHTLNDTYYFENSNFSDVVLKKNTIIGHSHHQFKIQIGKHFLYNTGSLGQNRKFINQSCYIKYNTISKEIQLCNFTHDIDILIDKMKIEGYPKICVEYYLSKARK